MPRSRRGPFLPTRRMPLVARCDVGSAAPSALSEAGLTSASGFRLIVIPCQRSPAPVDGG